MITVIKESIPSQSDLTNATTAANHTIPLGHRITVWDDSKEMEKEYIYLQISTGKGTAYVPYVVNYTGTTGLEVNTGAPSCSTGIGAQGNISELVVLPVTCTSGMYAWGQTKGAALCAITASTAPLAAAKLIGVINAAAVVSSTTGAAAGTQPSNAFGIVTASATSSATSVAVNLYGRLALVTS